MHVFLDFLLLGLCLDLSLESILDKSSSTILDRSSGCKVDLLSAISSESLLYQ